MVEELIPNLPAGPLDRYRRNASFDWKKFKIFLESEEIIQFTNDFYRKLKQYPVFHSKLTSLTLNEIRHGTARQVFTLHAIPAFQAHYDDPRKSLAVSSVIFNLDPSVAIKSTISELFAMALLTLGTERHLPLVQDVYDEKIFGCFCLTEIGHGTNTRGMRCTATYNVETKEFILNTPDFESAKCWAANLGQTATHAVVYAKLVTPDGVHHGLHGFIVPIRDPNSLLPLPGIIVGDMGPKAGLNGIDNGFLMINNCRIPREYLLNKNADVNDAGQFIPVIKDQNRMHGSSLGTLSPLRISIVHISFVYLTKALTIAVRYAAVRKQFGPEGKEELPIIEYQLHQHRLLPYLAANYHLKFLAENLLFGQSQLVKHKLSGTTVDYNAVSEMHALSCAAKPIAGWIARDGIQECREACGGHGYLQAAGISDLRSDNDANCTYDGENHVLIQQTSNWLLRFWPDIQKRNQITTPLSSVNFLSNGLQILNTKFRASSIGELSTPENIIPIYQWLTCYLLKITYEKYESNIKKGMDPFTAKNENQVFYARSLGIAYIQHYTLCVMNTNIRTATDTNIKRILEKLLALYGLFSLEKHIAVLYQGGYASGEGPVNLIQEAILKLCSEIKGDAVSLVDAIAPPDFLLKSVLGASDGLVYHRLQSDFYQSSDCMARPSWWKDMIDRSYVRAKM